MKQMKETLPAILPGFILAVALAYLSQIIAQFAPQLGAGTLGLCLGILFGNTIFTQNILAQGTKFSESKLLEIAVCLLGLSITLPMLETLGLRGFIFVICLMAVTIMGTYLIGKKLAFNEQTALLMAGGNAVCGSSAIGALAPVVRASDREKGETITLVNLLGTLLMFLIPFIGQQLYSEANPVALSAMIGGILPSVGQVAASANFFSEEVVQLSMLFKILRILLLIVVVITFEKFANKQQPMTDTPTKKGKKHMLPWYIVGFGLLFTFHQLVTVPTIVYTWSECIRNWCENIALVAIGLRLNLRQFIKNGPTYAIYGVSVGALQIIAAILLIYFIL